MENMLKGYSYVCKVILELNSCLLTSVYALIKAKGCVPIPKIITSLFLLR